MATDAGELVVKLRADMADLTQGLKQANNSVSNFGVGTIAIGTALGLSFEELGKRALEFGIDAVKAFAEQEVSLTRLSNLVGGEAAASFKEYADQLQKTTTFSDDAVLSLEAQLASYGVLPGSIKEATHAAVEFAAQTGKDLPEAGAALGRALNGQSRELKLLGLDLNSTSSRSENLEKTTKFLEGRFGSMAETLRGDTLGQVEALTNKFEDLKKKLGEQLLPIATKFLQWANDAIEPLAHLNDASKKYSDTVEGQKEKLADLTLQAKTLVSNGIGLLPKALTDTIKATGEHIKALQKHTAATHSNTGATETEIDAIRKLKDQILGEEQVYKHIDQVAKLSSELKIQQAQNELAIMDAQQMQITLITNQETERRLLAAKLSYEANASFSDQLTVKLTTDIASVKSKFVDMAVSATDSLGQGVADMIMDGKRFSDVMKAIWQDMARQFIAQVAAMIAKWLVLQAMTGGTGGIGRVLGGFATGGMVNEPSVITGMRSGRSHFVAESGPEMIVPTSGSGAGGFNQPFGANGGGGGGGGNVSITIPISGQFLEGSPAKWQRFIRETVVPEIRRWTMASPTGPFQRRRGAATI